MPTTRHAPQRRSRKPRKQRATRPMILEAARRIARHEDWPAVTIRRVADELGYTSPLIYEHFRDKGDALTAILREGFGELAAAMASVTAHPVDPADPEAYALAVAGAYLTFARQEPAVYRLMNGMGGVPLDAAETGRGAALVCEVGMTALQTWAEACGVRIPDPLAATEVLWCVLHGVTCLALAGRLDEPGDAYAEARLAEAVRALLSGWRAMYALPVTNRRRTRAG